MECCLQTWFGACFAVAWQQRAPTTNDARRWFLRASFADSFAFCFFASRYLCVRYDLQLTLEEARVKDAASTGRSITRAPNV